jgi:phi LC3 family holin
MRVNWKARLKNKAWLATAASTIILSAQAILALFDITLDGGKLLEAANMLLGLGVVLGVIMDPTTPGIGDGE